MQSHYLHITISRFARLFAVLFLSFVMGSFSSPQGAFASPTYNLLDMKGRWYPDSYDDVLYNDVYQYFMFNESTDDVGMLKTHDQAVAACASIGGTLLSNFNFKNLGFKGNSTDIGASSELDEEKAIWFGLWRRMPETNQSAKDIISTEDGRAVLEYPDDPALPPTGLLSPEALDDYYVDEDAIADASTHSCYTLKTISMGGGSSIKKRLRPVKCGGTPVTKEITVAIVAPENVTANATEPPEGWFEIRNRSSVVYHQALTICQRPFRDMTTKYTIPSMTPSGTLNTTAGYSSLAPQARWHRNEVALRVSPVAQDDFFPYKQPFDDVLIASQTADHVLNSMELFVSPIRVASVDKARQLCSAMDADLAVIPSVEYATRVVFPAIASLHGEVTLWNSTISQYHYGCYYASSVALFEKVYTLEQSAVGVSANAYTTANGAGGTPFCQLPATLGPRGSDDNSILAVQWGNGSLAAAILPNNIGRFYSESDSMSAHFSSVFGVQRATCPHSGCGGRKVLCTRQVMRVTAELMDGSELIAGSVGRLRLSLNHHLSTLGPVVVAVTAPLAKGVSFSKNVVKLYNASSEKGANPVAPVEIGFYIPTATTGTFAINCHVVAPVGAGIHPIVRWIRTRRSQNTETASIPLNVVKIMAPFTLSFTPASVTLFKGESATVTATLSRPSNGDFVIVSDFDNMFVSASVLVFPKGSLSTTFRLRADGSTSSAFAPLNFTGISFVPQPIFGVPSAEYFYTHDATVYSPSVANSTLGRFQLQVKVNDPPTMSWFADEDFVYDGLGGSLLFRLNIAPAPTQSFEVSIETNCTPYVYVLDPSKTFTTSTTFNNFEIMVQRRVYYPIVYCYAQATTTSTQEMPEPFYFTIRKRSNFVILRQPTHSYTDDGATIVLQLDRFWDGPVAIRFTFGGNSGCSSLPSQDWVISSSASSWIKALSLPTSGNYGSCTISTSIPTGYQNKFRRTLYNGTELTQLYIFSRYTAKGSNPAKASVNRLYGDPREMFPETQIEFMVWMMSDNVPSSSNFSNTFTDPSQASAYAAQRRGSYCVNITRVSAPSTKIAYRLVPIYNASTGMYYSLFAFRAADAGEYSIVTYSCYQAATGGGYSILLDDLGSLQITVQPTPRVGILCETVDGTRSTTIPTQLLQYTSLRLYLFHTVTVPANTSTVTLTLTVASVTIASITLNGIESSIPVLTLPIGAIGATYKIAQSATGPSVWSVPYHDLDLVSSSFTTVPTVVWSNHTFDGDSFNTTFCATLSYSGSSSVVANVSVVPYFSPDVIQLQNASNRVTLNLSKPSALFCFNVIAVRRSFELVAEPATNGLMPVSLQVNVTRPLRFLRAVPITGYAQYGVVSRWTSTTAQRLSFELPSAQLLSTSTGIRIRLERYGERSSSALSISNTKQTGSSSDSLFISAADTATIPGSSSSSIFLLTVTGTTLSTSSVNVIDLCGSPTQTFQNCQTIPFLDPPSILDSMCLVRPEGYVPSYFGGQSSVANVGPIPYASLWLFSNTTNSSTIRHIEGPYPPLVPLRLKDASKTIPELSAQQFALDAQYSEADFSIQPPKDTLFGGDDGLPVSIAVSPPYPQGWNIDPTTSLLSNLTATKVDGYGQRTLTYSCDAFSPLWAVRASVPVISNINTTMRVGDRGAQTGVIFVAPPPWFAFQIQKGQFIRMDITATGTNASSLSISPNSFQLYANKTTTLLNRIQTTGRSVDPLKDLFFYKFTLSSNRSFGASNISLRITFSPVTPFYANYAHTENITVLPLLSFTSQYDSDKSLFGCYDYLLANFSLSPIPARPIHMSLDLNQTTLGVRMDPSVVTEAATVINFTATNCSLMNSSNPPTYSKVDVKTSGLNALEYTLPSGSVFMLRSKLEASITPPQDTFYVDADNAVTLMVKIERRPKPNRRLTLLLSCMDLNTTRGDTCYFNRTNVTFDSNAPSLSVPVSWHVTYPANYSVWLTTADWSAPEFLPIEAKFEISANAKKPTTVSLIGDAYTHLPAGKELLYRIQNPALGFLESLRIRVSLNVSGVCVLSLNGGAFNASVFANISSVAKLANISLKALSNISSPTPVQLRFDVVASSASTLAKDTTPQTLTITVVPQHKVNFTANSLSYYLGTSFENLITFSAPLPYNRLEGTNPFGPIIRANFFVIPGNGSVSHNFTSIFQSTSQQMDLNSNNLQMVAAAQQLGSAAFKICWSRMGDTSTKYAFEYLDAYNSTPECLSFDNYTQAVIGATVDYDWYLGDTLEVTFQAPAADLNRCRIGTTVEITTSNPTLQFNWTRTEVDFVPPTDRNIRTTLQSLLLPNSSTGVQTLSWTVSGTCYNFVRSGNVSLFRTNYRVNSPSNATVKGFPKIMFLNDTRQFTVTTSVRAFHDGTENSTQFNLNWTGISNSAILNVVPGSAIHATVDTNRFTTRFPKALDIVVNYTITASKVQTTYATWMFSVAPPRDRYIGSFDFPLGPNENNSFIIPAIQTITLNSALNDVKLAITSPYPTNKRVFFGEQFCVIILRPATTYNVVYNVTMITNTTLFSPTTPTTRVFGTSAVLNQSICYTVLSTPSNGTLLAFSTRQSNNLYAALQNNTIIVSAPTVVRMKNGTFSKLVCGAENSRLIELIPDRPPIRDAIVLNVTVFGPSIARQTFELKWNSTNPASQLSRFIDLSIPCGLRNSVTINVVQTFNSKEYTSVAGEGSFTFSLLPKGNFTITNLRDILFEAQDVILLVAPSQAPVQYPLTLTLSAFGVLIDPSTLYWEIGDASARQVEFYGHAPGTAAISLFANPSNEFTTNKTCFGEASLRMPTCALEVVNNAKLSSTNEELIVFIGFPQNFTLEVAQCATGSDVTVSLSPFEFADAIILQPATFGFTCDTNKDAIVLPQIRVSPLNKPSVVGQKTQILVIATQSINGATTFRSVDSLSRFTVEVRTPAVVNVEVSSGDSIFVSRTTTLTITLPHPPSDKSVIIIATVDNENITSVGPSISWSKATVPLTGTIAVQLKSSSYIAGTSVITLNITGDAASEYFFANTGGGSYNRFMAQKALVRRMPFEVNGSVTSTLRWGRHTQNISYPYTISLQQAPQLAREQISVLVSFSSGVVTASYTIIFRVNETTKSFNFSLPLTGNYSISGVVTGSNSYVESMRVAQSFIFIHPLLDVTADPLQPTQYANVGQQNIQSISVYIPPLLEPHYRVSIATQWNAPGSRAIPACEAAKAELQASVFTYTPSVNQPVAIQTRLSVYSKTAGMRCRLYLNVSGSKEFSTTLVDVGYVEFLPLREILTPPIISYQILVGSQFKLMVNVSALPPVGIVYGIEATSRNDAGVVVTPTKQNITNSSVPFVVFTISSSAEGTVVIPFKCVPTGNDNIYSFDLNRQLDITVRTLSLLEAIFTYGNIVYFPISETNPNAAPPRAIDVFVETSNTVPLTVIFPAFSKFNAPPFVRAYASTSNSSFLAAAFTTSLTSEPSLTLTPGLVYPYAAQLSLTGTLPVASRDATQEVELIVRINSSTQEYRHLSRFRVIVRPLFYLTVAASFKTLYSGTLNAGILIIKPNCSAWPLAVGSRLSVELATSCNILIFDRLRSFTSCDAQQVTVTATTGGECTMEVRQVAATRVSLFTSESATLPIEAIAQAEISYLLYVNGKLVDGSLGVTADQVRTQGITIRLFSSGIGFHSKVAVTPFNESAITIASTQPNNVYKSLEEGQTYKSAYTGFWRALTTAMDLDLNADGSSQRSYSEVVDSIIENNNRSTVRWSISSTQQQDEVTIQIAPLPTYSTDRDEVITIKCKKEAFIDFAYPNPAFDTISFKILAPEISASLAAKKETTANVVLAGASISAALSVYSAASSIRVLSVVTLSRCPSTTWKDNQDSMELFFFPFRNVMPFLIFENGSAESLGVYAGAIVGNTIIMVGVIIVHGLLVAIVARLRIFEGLSTKDLFGLLRFPSLCWFPLSVLYAPTVVASVRVLLYSSSPALKVLASASVLIYAIAVPAAALLLTVKSQVLIYTSPIRSTMFQWLFNMGHFKHPLDSYWTGRYAEVLLPLRGETRWWFASDLIVMTFLSFAIAVAPETNGQCLVRNILICLIFFGMFFAVLIMQPMSRKIDNFFFAIVALLHAVAVSIAISQTSSSSSSDTSSSDTPPNGGSTGGGTTAPSATTTTTTTAPASSLTTISNAANDFFGSTDKDLLVQNLLLATAILVIVRATVQWLQTLTIWATLCSSLHRAAAHEEMFRDPYQDEKRGRRHENRNGMRQYSDEEMDGKGAKAVGTKSLNPQKLRRNQRIERMRSLHMSETLLTHDSDEDEIITNSSEDNRYHHHRGGSSSSSSDDVGSGGYGRQRKHNRAKGRFYKKKQSTRDPYEEEIGVEPLDEQTAAQLRDMGDEALATVYDLDIPASPSKHNAKQAGSPKQVVKMKGFQRAFDPTVIAFDPLARQAREYNSGGSEYLVPSDSQQDQGSRGTQSRRYPLYSHHESYVPPMLPQYEYDAEADGPNLRNWEGEFYHDARRL